MNQSPGAQFLNAIRWYQIGRGLLRQHRPEIEALSFDEAFTMAISDQPVLATVALVANTNQRVWCDPFEKN